MHLLRRKKSGDRMREILSSGKTGVLVSHSVGQIRELCNKVLWLDRGTQIAFSDDVSLYCDAYEEYLASKKLPKNNDDVLALAKGHDKRMEQERKKRAEAETKRLQSVLEKGSTDEAISAAVRIISKSKPELLVENYRELLG